MKAISINHHGSRIGRFITTVDDMHEPYITPQENGSRYKTEWACVTSKKGEGILFTGDKDFSFNASRYTPEILTKATHPYELVESGNIIVHTDYMMSGVGSGSCGPQLLPQYRMNHEQIRFNLFVLPTHVNYIR